MTDHKTGTREEWLAARLELLEAEKELTRRGDELARQRQELPWVPIPEDTLAQERFAVMYPGREALSTTCASRTRPECPCCISQSSVADALRAASMAGELTRTMLCARSNIADIAECMMPVPQSVRMML